MFEFSPVISFAKLGPDESRLKWKTFGLWS